MGSDKEVRQSVKFVDNLEINNDKNFVVVSINPKIYSLDVIYAATHSFIDKSYVVIDGKPNGYIFVGLSPFKDYSLEAMGRDFNNELISYAISKIQLEFDKKIYINEKESSLGISVDPSFYSHAAVICACQPYLERFWVYLDYRNGRYQILIKPKNDEKADFGMVEEEFFKRMLGKNLDRR